MRMNRRNVLFVLGTTILLGGALIASGAFSQVEADRTMSIETAGDSSALLGIDANTSEYNGVEDTNSNGEELKLRFYDLNSNATTTFNDVLNITNNGNNEIKLNATTEGDVTLYDGSTDLSQNDAVIASGESVTIDIEIDLKGKEDVNDNQTVTFTATDNT